VKWSWLCALAALGCADAGTDATGRASAPLEPTTRDSSGVTIHEHPADALERAPLITMDSVPLATFVGDLVDPARDISSISWLTFTESGDLVGIERTERQLVVLRVVDQSQRRYGRRGAGPLEIGSGGALAALANDSLIFVDQANARFVVVHPDSGVIRTISQVEVADLRNNQMLSRLGDSVFLLSGSVWPGAGGGPPKEGIVEIRRTLRLWHAGSDSVVILAELPGDKMFQKVFTNGPPGTWTTVGHGIALAGPVHIHVWDGQFAVAGGSSWQVSRWDTEGQVRSVVRLTRPPRMVDEALFSRSVDLELEGAIRNDTTRDVDSTRQAIRARPHADTAGVFQGMHPTPQGRLWMVDYMLPGDSGWAATLLDRDGRILGRIIEPTGDRPRAFGNDRLAFRTEDEDGIATITVRRLRLPE
jgi:hypothetical protein